jgi:hypothetical protein
MSVRCFFKNPALWPWLPLFLVASAPSACGSDAPNGETSHTPGDGDGDSPGDADDGNDDDQDHGDGDQSEGDGDQPGDGDGDGAGDGDGDDGPAPLTSVSAADFCTTLTTLLCQAEQACCQTAGVRYENVEACVQAENASCLSDIQPAALDARTGYSATGAAAKLNELQAKLVSCDQAIGEWLVAADGLVAVFEGTVDAGGDCTPAGDTDAAALLSCKPGSVCRVSPVLLSAKGTCGAEKSSGEGCVSELECAQGLRCDPPKDIISGQCKARLPDGQGCVDNSDCESLLCAGGSCTPRSQDAVYCLKAS